MDELIKILMHKFEWTRKEAIQDIRDCSQELLTMLDDGEDPYDICADWWGLEPDYLVFLM